VDNLLVYTGALTLAGQQVAEHLFGGLIHGAQMKYLALLTTVAISYGVWALAWGPIADWDAIRVGVLGVFAGMGTNVLDGLVKRYAPAAKDATLSKAAATFLARAPASPRPPLPPSPGR
jgi:hypothetical protein